MKPIGTGSRFRTNVEAAAVRFGSKSSRRQFCGHARTVSGAVGNDDQFCYNDA